MLHFLKRQSLYKKIAVYLGTSWALIEASNYFINRYKYPDYFGDALLLILAFGLIYLILAEWKTYKDEINKSSRLFHPLLIIYTLACVIFISVFIKNRYQNLNEYRKSADKISIAVLPFEDLSPGKTNEWLGERIEG